MINDVIDVMLVLVSCFCHVQCQKLGNIFTGAMYKLLLSFTVISVICLQVLYST